MSKRRIATRHIGAGHDRSIEREAEQLELERRHRLAEASSGDEQHADRIADVIRLPRPPLQQFAELHDQELEQEELEHAALGLAWLLAALLGLVIWVVLAVLAFGAYELVQALA